jgi:hypothetical protein
MSKKRITVNQLIEKLNKLSEEEKNLKVVVFGASSEDYFSPEIGFIEDSQLDVEHFKRKTEKLVVLH